MSRRLMSVQIRGKHHNWSFEFQGNPKHLDEWREDGLEIYEVYNTIPEWVADAGLTRVWCFMQDIFNFRNPLRGN